MQELQVLSLQLMVELTSKRTLRIIGRLGKTEVVVLIDSGASCSFIEKRLTTKLGLVVVPTDEFGVAIGYGRVIRGQGKCQGLELEIQGVMVRDEYLLFELGMTYVVLGYTWLVQLGETRINWGLHIMRFQVENEWVTILGDPSLLRSQVSLNSMEKMCENEEVVLLPELQALFENASENKHTRVPHKKIQSLLKSFASVFQMPSGLPPGRSRVHAITLQAGTSPINI